MALWGRCSCAFRPELGGLWSLGPLGLESQGDRAPHQDQTKRMAYLDASRPWRLGARCESGVALWRLAWVWEAAKARWDSPPLLGQGLRCFPPKLRMTSRAPVPTWAAPALSLTPWCWWPLLPARSATRASAGQRTAPCVRICFGGRASPLGSTALGCCTGGKKAPIPPLPARMVCQRPTAQRSTRWTEAFGRQACSLLC